MVRPMGVCRNCSHFSSHSCMPCHLYFHEQQMIKIFYMGRKTEQSAEMGNSLTLVYQVKLQVVYVVSEC